MSLGLVAYGSSDESGTDEETSEPSVAVVKKSASDIVVSANNIASSSRCSRSESIIVKSHNVNVASDNKINDSSRQTCCTVLNSVSMQISDDEDETNVDKMFGSSSTLGNSVDVNDQEKPDLSLPAPKTSKLHDIDFDWSRLSNKKSTAPIKISVPSLADLDSEEGLEPIKKKLKPSKMCSGLFALLPSPKNSYTNIFKSSLKPQQLNSKARTIPPVKQVKKTAPNTKTLQSKSKETPLSLDHGDSPDECDESDDTVKVDFFSLSSPVKVPESEIQVPEDIDRLINSYGSQVTKNKPEQYSRVPSLKKDGEDLKAASSSASQADTEADAPFVGPSMRLLQTEDDLQLDEVAMQQLCGRRQRTAGGSNVEFIDIQGDAILPDAREWMTKQLTEEKNLVAHSHKKKDGPTTQQRRKHQITYLAFQAKEHELELKNQWANNRMSRKQTQAKYGF